MKYANKKKSTKLFPVGSMIVMDIIRARTVETVDFAGAHLVASILYTHRDRQTQRERERDRQKTDNKTDISMLVHMQCT